MERYARFLSFATTGESRPVAASVWEGGDRTKSACYFSDRLVRAATHLGVWDLRSKRRFIGNFGHWEPA